MDISRVFNEREFIFMQALPTLKYIQGYGS